jgi:hypothetical protein
VTKGFPEIGGTAMKKKFFHKCFVALFLFFFVISSSVGIAKANSIEIGKNEEYRLNVKSITLVKGKIFALKTYNSENAKVSFKSADQEIASVSDEGVITAIKVGNTIITATIKDETTVTYLNCDVLVGPPAFSVKITNSRIIIGLDKTDFLNVILKPSNTFEDAKFSSYDSSIVSVSPGGRITAKKFGLTYIFAQIEATDNNDIRKYDTCTVISVNPEEVASLETYLDNPDMDLIGEAELTKALDEFFNVKYVASSSTSLVDSLNSYLDEKFGLANLKKIRDDNLAKILSNSSEVISGKTSN